MAKMIEFTPAQVVDLGGGKYRYLTERECWRMQGYTDADFEAAAAVQKKNGWYAMALYKCIGLEPMRTGRHLKTVLRII